jgi:hypothetical protein
MFSFQRKTQPLMVGMINFTSFTETTHFAHSFFDTNPLGNGFELLLHIVVPHLCEDLAGASRLIVADLDIGRFEADGKMHQMLDKLLESTT